MNAFGFVGIFKRTDSLIDVDLGWTHSSDDASLCATTEGILEETRKLRLTVRNMGRSFN